MFIIVFILDFLDWFIDIGRTRVFREEGRERRREREKRREREGTKEITAIAIKKYIA